MNKTHITPHNTAEPNAASAAIRIEDALSATRAAIACWGRVIGWPTAGRVSSTRVSVDGPGGAVGGTSGEIALVPSPGVPALTCRR